MFYASMLYSLYEIGYHRLQIKMHPVVVCNLLIFILLLKLLYIFLFPIFFCFTMKNIPPAVDHSSQMLSNLFAFILFYVYLPFLIFFRFLRAISYRDTGVFSTCLQHVYTNSTQIKFRENSDVFTGFDEDIDSE